MEQLREEVKQLGPLCQVKGGILVALVDHGDAVNEGDKRPKGFGPALAVAVYRPLCLPYPGNGVVVAQKAHFYIIFWCGQLFHLQPAGQLGCVLCWVGGQQGL